MKTVSIVDAFASIAMILSYLYASIKKERINESIQLNTVNIVVGILAAGTGYFAGLYGVLIRQVFFVGISTFNLIKTKKMKKSEVKDELARLGLQDLQFVYEKFDTTAIKKEFKSKYQQRLLPSMFQTEVKKHSSKKISVKPRIKDDYGITEVDLAYLLKFVFASAVRSGVHIEYVDMTSFIEDDIYNNIHTEVDHKKHHETARSDGKTLYLEKNIVAAGGYESRIYDILHLAFGHMVQWSTNDKSMLLSNEEAWKIGYRNHEKSPSKIIDLMSLYELEAGMLGIGALKVILEQTHLPESKKEALLQYYVDYVFADSKYIIQHYRGNFQKFESFWTYGNPIPYETYTPKVDVFIKRHHVEIGLIQ